MKFVGLLTIIMVLSWMLSPLSLNMKFVLAEENDIQKVITKSNLK